MKLTKIEGKKDEIYTNPEVPLLIDALQEFIKTSGVQDMIILVSSGCGSYSEWFETSDRTEAGLGLIERYKFKYVLELENGEEEVE